MKIVFISHIFSKTSLVTINYFGTRIMINRTVSKYTSRKFYKHVRDDEEQFTNELAEKPVARHK